MGDRKMAGKDSENWMNFGNLVSKVSKNIYFTHTPSWYLSEINIIANNSFH